LRAWNGRVARFFPLTHQGVSSRLLLFWEGETMGKKVSLLYRLARLANDIEKVKSGDPKKIAEAFP